LNLVTPILTFPRQGGRNFGSVNVAALGTYMPLSAYQEGRKLLKEVRLYVA